MTLLLNIIWLVCGGFVSACAWFAAGILAAISVVGLPWAPACFRIGGFTLMPFGREAVDRRLLTGYDDAASGPLGTVGNVIWLITLGLPLAVVHLAAAVLLACTIIGIPFAWQHVKLAGISLWPIGTEVVDAGLADAALRRGFF